MQPINTFIFFFATLVSFAAADQDCCLCHHVGNQDLCVKWASDTDTFTCATSGQYPNGTTCSVDSYTTPNNFLQANVTLKYGGDADAFGFRLNIGIDNNSCKQLKPEQVQSGWEGWGATLFDGGEIKTEWMSKCKDVGL